MNIGQAARTTGVSERMIRHYERMDRMKLPPTRIDSGFIDLVIDELYDTVGSEDDGAIARLLTDLVRGRSAVIQVTDLALRPLAIESNYFSDAMIDAYCRDRVYEDDVWADVIRRTEGLDRVHLLDEMVTGEVFRTSRFHDGFIRAWGDDTGHCIGLGTRFDVDHILTVGIHRPFGHPFSEIERAALDRVLPHLRRVSKAHGRIRQVQSTVGLREAALAALPQPCLVIDMGRRIAFANARAEAILARGDVLVQREGRLVATEPRAANALQAALDRCLSRSEDRGGSVLLRPSDGGPAYHLQVLPCPAASGLTTAMVLVDDPNASIRDKARQLGPLYGLTHSEVEIAAHVAAGLSLAEAALLRGTTLATIKTLLGRCYQKTGTERQAQLAALVNRLA